MPDLREPCDVLGDGLLATGTAGATGAVGTTRDRTITIFDRGGGGRYTIVVGAAVARAAAVAGTAVGGTVVVVEAVAVEVTV